MRFPLLLPAAAMLFAVSAAAAPGSPAVAHAVAHIETTMGAITIALDADKAPETVANFVRYAKAGHYNGTLFYRVVPGFVIQAGSFGADGNYRQTRKPIPLETATGLSNTRGAVAMARTDVPASATAEFFIDLADVNATALDAKPGAAPNTTGYAVFGRVTDGMEVVDKIAAVETGGGSGPFPDAAPKTAVVIKKVTIEEVPVP